MEVLDKKNAILTNVEVLKVLRDTRRKENALPKHQRSWSVGTVLYETMKYLQNSPAGSQKNSSVKEFSKKVQPYEMRVIIEEVDERLTEEQIKSLVAVSVQT
ncbi:unnamed protein product [Thelazia callipaeda]|uniref:DNA-directed RNA polymerase III subunit RPC9 n=1 Tax=Thelazia callipaeda TaxID=103827 RepID=A0A0N5CXN2_THECL|nr:unnamed protein product [Thelazia callipaeda]